ncbi:MAG: hypothetical protein AAGC81_16900 [Pseudomonadota bacterium]
MKKLLVATAVVATAFAGAAQAESTVVQQQQKLDRIFAEQGSKKGETRQVSSDRSGSFFSRTFGEISFGAVNPGKAERGISSGRFGSSTRAGR